jgi:hypothetical protein
LFEKMNKAPKSMRRRREQKVAVKKGSLIWGAAKLLFTTGVATTVAYLIFSDKPVTNHLTSTPKIPIKKELKIEGSSLKVETNDKEKNIQDEYKLSQEEIAHLQAKVSAPPAVIAKPGKSLDDDFVSLVDSVEILQKMEERKRRWVKQVPDAMKAAASKGILKEFRIVEQKTGIPEGVLPTISMFESNMTDNPLAEGDVLQVKGGTFLDAFCNYKDNFVKTYRHVKSQREIVETVDKLAPYVKRVYNKDTGKMDFVFNERGYFGKYKQLPKVDGKRYRSLEQTVKSLVKVSFVQIAFTASHLLDLRMQLAKKFQNDPEGLEYLASIGSSAYRLLHIYGVGGVGDIVIHRDGTIAQALPRKHHREQIHVQSPGRSTRQVIGGVQKSFDSVRNTIRGYQVATKNVAITEPVREKHDSEGTKVALALLRQSLQNAERW